MRGSESISSTPALGQLAERPLDVADRVGDVVQPGALAVEELADRGLGPERAEQLHVAVADVEQHGLDALLGSTVSRCTSGIPKAPS